MISTLARFTSVCLVILAASFSSPPMAFGDEGGKAALTRHWSRPARAFNDVKPAGFSPYPVNCAACHNEKWSEWSGSLHSGSVGPGLTAQLAPYSEPAFALSCYRCHAPLLEQSEVIATDDEAGYRDNPSFDEELQKTGVGCAACHLREGAIYGPPAPTAPPSPLDKTATPSPPSPHTSKGEGFFTEAEFCAACHQLDEGYELNGKVLINTYREWKGSVYGEQNITCQSCHMPGRKHLFRGIHDPGMTGSGVRIEAERSRGGGGAKGGGGGGGGGTVSATLKITNAAVGHYFPTYPTPAVVVKGFLKGPDGMALEGTVKEGVVGRRVPIDLSTEEFDTRIPPLETFTFDYDAGEGGGTEGAEALVLEVWVYPDEFYNRFFTALLSQKHTPGVEENLKEALISTERSKYLLFKKELPLAD
jgi:hypothetical protein